MSAAYLHTLDPFAIQFTDSFGIRWYGLAYLGGFLSGYLITGWLLKKPRMLVSRELLSDFVFSVALGCIVGGRLGYCVFYRPDLFLDFRSAIPFWGPLAVYEGGMASHGGIIGMILACWWFSRRSKIPFLHLGDLVIYGSTLGIFFGRVANFINGELVGRACEGKCWFPVKFPQDILTWPSYHPEWLPKLASVVSTLGISKAQWTEWLAWGQMGQVSKALHDTVVQVEAGNKAVQSSLAPLLVARYPSQIYAAFLEGGFLFVVLFWVWRKPRKPGYIASLFLLLYPIGRVLSEQFRQPDLYLGFQALGLTRGQWLSVVMFLFGVGLFVTVLRSKSEKLGGWSQR